MFLFSLLSTLIKSNHSSLNYGGVHVHHSFLGSLLLWGSGLGFQQTTQHLVKSARQIKRDRRSEWLIEWLIAAERRELSTSPSGFRAGLLGISINKTRRKCNNSSQYSCQRVAFVFVLGQGNKLIGSLHLKGAMAGLWASPRRNLKPCKSAIVWATWGAQGDLPLLSLSRGLI